MFCLFCKAIRESDIYKWQVYITWWKGRRFWALLLASEHVWKWELFLYINIKYACKFDITIIYDMMIELLTAFYICKSNNMEITDFKSIIKMPMSIWLGINEKIIHFISYISHTLFIIIIIRYSCILFLYLLGLPVRIRLLLNLGFIFYFFIYLFVYIDSAFFFKLFFEYLCN